MNIKILDSWLREYVKTDAKPDVIAEKLSLTSVGIEHIITFKNDFVYDIEVTTNRPELMSVLGIAQEAATVLPQSNIKATFSKPDFIVPNVQVKNDIELSIKHDPKLVRRIMAVVMEVTLKDSPQKIKDRLESSDIRSLNNVIDVTNYVMRETGHPTHVFDYDRLTDHTLLIRESKQGERITTLDGKEYVLSGGDIVAYNQRGQIIDLLGIMGTANSVVTNDTKRILFFIDNVEPNHIRKTSMELGIRTDAAILNEKDLNPEYVQMAFAKGIKLFEEIADGKIISEIIDIYPEKPEETTISITEEKITRVTGVAIPLKTSFDILNKLGFFVTQKEQTLLVTVPAEKSGVDMQIAEDLIEEIARIYGYHNIPNTLPRAMSDKPFIASSDAFFWEDRVKDMLKHWGFIETYTYPMVSQELLTGKVEDAVTIKNPLTEEFVYMRRTLIPSLLRVAEENKDHEILNLFEIANIYEKNGTDLPQQMLRLSGLMRKEKSNFYEVKGIVEQLLEDIGITEVRFKLLSDEREGATIIYGKETLGVIEVLDEKTIDFELDFDAVLTHVTLQRIYKPVSKFPPIVEDISIKAPNLLTGDMMELIKRQSPLIVDVTLLDKYQETRTFHITYQSDEKNLTNEDIKPIREKIMITLETASK